MSQVIYAKRMQAFSDFIYLFIYYLFIYYLLLLFIYPSCFLTSLAAILVLAQHFRSINQVGFCSRSLVKMREITGSIEQKDKGTSSDIESWEDALSRRIARRIFDKISFPYSLFRGQCNCVFYFNLIIIQGSRRDIMDFFLLVLYICLLSCL